MNANQKIHNATLSKWLDLFKDQVASGKSVKAWCADNGYSTYACRTTSMMYNSPHPLKQPAMY